MSNYKTSLSQSQLAKSNILAAGNDDDDDNNTNDDENHNDFEIFNEVCVQFFDCINKNDPRNIRKSLQSIRVSISKYKKSCIPILVEFDIFELIAQLLEHTDNKVRISSVRTIYALIYFIKDTIQYFFEVNDIIPLLFQVINTCNNVDGIYFGLYSLYFLFKKYNSINPDLFYTKLSIPYLNSVYCLIESLPFEDNYKRKIDIYNYIALFYIKMCKTKIDQNQYNDIIIPWISHMFLLESDDLTSFIFRLLKNLIVYDSMPKKDFFKNNYIANAIQDMIIDSPELNIAAYNLLTAIFDKGFQVKELLEKDEDQDGMASTGMFDKLMVNTLNSIDKYQHSLKDPKLLDQYGEVSAAATRMITSAIRNDDDCIIVNILTTDLNNNFGFISIVDNLCISGIFSLSNASSYCLIEILSRVNQATFLKMNNGIYKSREGNKLIKRSFVFALLTIAQMDDEHLVFQSLAYLYDLTNCCIASNNFADIKFDYFSVDGPDLVNGIINQNENAEIIHLCENILKIYNPKK